MRIGPARTIRIFALSWALAFLAGAAQSQIPDEDQLRETAGRFNKAVAGGDFDLAWGFMAAYGQVLPRLSERVFFGGEPARDAFPLKGRTMVEIANAAKVRIEVARQDDGSYIVSFIDMTGNPGPLSLEFFTEQWMQRYYACWFKKIGDRWKIVMNFCFNETDGPYAQEYG